MGQPIDTASVEIVADFSSFQTQLTRGIDATMRQLSTRIEAAFGRVEGDASRAGTAIGNDISGGSERAESGLRELGRQSDRTFGEMRRDANTAGAALAGIGAIAGKLGIAGAAAGAAAGLGILAAFGLKTAGALEQSQVAFNSLLGSVQEGQRVFNQLKQFAAATPFELTDLTGTAQRFLAFAETAGMAKDQLFDFLTVVGDISSVTAAGAFGMERVALALGQIASTGKVTGDNLLQINDALPGFSSIAAIAAGAGLSLADATKAITSGAISSKDGIQFLLEGMRNFGGAAGAMEAQSKTLVGVFATFKDNVSQALAGAFDPVLPAIKKSLGDLTPLLSEAAGIIAVPLGQSLADTMAALGPALKPLAQLVALTIKALSPFVVIIVQIVGIIAEALVPVFEALAPALIELAPSIVLIVEALAPLLIVIGMILNPLLKLVGLIVNFLAQKAIVPLIQLLSLALAGAAIAIGAFVEWLTRVDWGAVFGAIGDFFADIGSVISDFFGGFTDRMKELPEKAALFFGQVRANIAARITDVINGIKALPGRFVAALANLGGLLVDKGRDMVRGLFNGIASMGGWLVGKIKSFVTDKIVGSVKAALGISSPSTVMAAEVGRWIPPGIAVGVEDGMPDLMATIDDLVGSASARPMEASTDARTVGQVVFGPGSIVINFGTLPTTEQALAVGRAVASGIASRASARQANAAAAAAL